MSTSSSVRVYQVLLRCYPRRFRQEYGGDMSLMFAEQLRNEPAARVWMRGSLDLALTIPAQHLEAHMHKPSPTAVPVLFASLSAAGLLLLIVGGTNTATRTIGIVTAAVFLALANFSHRRARPVAAEPPASALWWKLLLAGMGSLGTILIVTNVTGEVREFLWVPLMVAIGTSVVLLAAGVVLAISHFTAAGRSKATS